MTNPNHTDTSRSCDLVGRLRSVDVSWSETGEWCAEAADRIEALVAEVEGLREAMVVMDNTVRELTEALTQIAEPCSVVVEPSGKAGEGWKKMYYAWRKIAVDRVDIARKALGDTHD